MREKKEYPSPSTIIIMKFTLAICVVLALVVTVTADDNLEAGRAYLRSYAKESGVTELPSGVLYKVLQAGSGSKPGATDTVRVHYEGTLIDGKEFDSSYRRGTPATFGVNQVISGWSEVLQLMPAGSVWEVVIPSEKAYGARGAGGLIPPNSVLKFKIELLDIEGRDL